MHNPRGCAAAVHSWDISTGVDGPGTRFVLFLAGCPLRCRYCQNPDTWRMRDGHRMELDEVLLEVERYRRFLHVAHGGVTFSGGEPLLPSRFGTGFFRPCRGGRGGKTGVTTRAGGGGPPPLTVTPPWATCRNRR